MNANFSGIWSAVAGLSIAGLLNESPAHAQDAASPPSQAPPRAVAEGTPGQGGAATSSAAAFAFGHASIGAGAGVVLIDDRATSQRFFAVSVMPQLQVSLSLNERDTVRVETGLQWTGITRLINGQELMATAARGEPYVATIGVGFRIRNATSAFQRVGFEFGYGNLPAGANAFAHGPVVVLHLESDLMHFEFP